MRFSDLFGKQVTVWGYGREGRSVTQHCRALGITVEVAEPDLDDGSANEVRYGAAGRDALLASDVVIKSPGVPVTSNLYRELAAAGIAITSLTDLWLSDNHARVVAVTGTKGKSTTSSLIRHLLESLGHRAVLRGNIGTSVLEEPDPPADIVVMELSSYQAQSLSVSPRIVVVTSLFPEHLTWHGSAEAYFTDKLSAVAHGPEYVVAPADAPDLVRRIRERIDGSTQLLLTDSDSVHADSSGDIVWPDGAVMKAGELPLLGLHNARNIALAARATELFGGTAPQVIEALGSFAPLPHRMEKVPSTDGRTWIDDSLATVPEAVVATLRTLPQQRVSVIVGGADRGLDYQPLLDYLRTRTDITLVLIGPAGARIAAEWPLPQAGTVFATFSEAMSWARSSANPADVVLLSPGAPSFDEFADYEAKSAAFRAAAMLYC